MTCAGVAAGVVVVLLEVVQLLDDRERDDDLVLLEQEDRVGVVQQHVRVEDEVLRRGGMARLGVRVSRSRGAVLVKK